MNFKESGEEGVDWIHVAQDRAHWQAVLNTVMNIHIYNHKNLKQNILMFSCLGIEGSMILILIFKK